MIKSHFSNIRQFITEELRAADKNIKVAVCWFTCSELFEILCDKLKDGVSVELIVLNDSINNKTDGLDFQNFIDIGGKFYYGEIENPMHNKYCIIDDSTLINGSYNWTYFAETKNFENIIIFKEHEIVLEFLKDFFRLTENFVLVDKIVDVANFDSKQITIVENVKLASDTDIIINKIKIIGNTQQTLNATLGESIHNDVFYPFIHKGSKIPISKTFNLSTIFDNQITCSNDIRYGDEKIGSLNTQIGLFTIADIPLMPQGKPGIITTFSIDEYCILTVSIKIRETGTQSFEKFDISNLIE